jgi:hypothetical protein
MAFHFRITLAASLILVALPCALFAAYWESTVSPATPGSFPEPRPVRVQYGFGWNGITAANADLHLTKGDGHIRLEGSGSTVGLARTLWKFDGKYSASTEERTLRAVHVHEVDTERSKTTETDVKFTPEGATSETVQKDGAKTKSKSRSFEFPHVMSLISSLLYLRSQPLTDGAVHRVVVYPATSAYLSTLTVLGHEHVNVPAGSYDAIKLDLQINKIGKERELKPHKKFKRATIWLSNDADRLVLRIEGQVFIGSVFAELQSVQFENGSTR